MKDEAVPRGGCLSWWRSVGEDKSKALKSLFVSGVLFERAWVLSLYRGGVVVILLMSAMGNPSESALLRVLSEGGDARAAVDVLGITEAGVEADLALLAKGGMLAIGLTQAVLYSLVVALLLLPRTSEWTLRRIVYFDAVFVAGLWLNQAFQPLDFTMPRDVRISFSKTIAELFIFTMGWAITLATSPHPSAARVAATLAVAGLPVFFCAKIVAGVLAPPWTSLSIFNAVLAGLWAAFLFWSWWFLFSPRARTGLPCACDTCTSAWHEHRRRKSQDMGALLEDREAPGQERAADTIDVRQLCWVGRLLRKHNDDDINLSVLTRLFWYGLPVLLAFFAGLLARAVIVDTRDKEATVIHPVLLAVCIVGLYSIFGAASLTVHVARAAVSQRDDLIHDLLPRKAAQALIKEHGERKAEGMSRRPRGPQERTDKSMRGPVGGKLQPVEETQPHVPDGSRDTLLRGRLVSEEALVGEGSRGSDAVARRLLASVVSNERNVQSGTPRSGDVNRLPSFLDTSSRHSRPKSRIGGRSGHSHSAGAAGLGRSRNTVTEVAGLLCGTHVEITSTAAQNGKGLAPKPLAFCENYRGVSIMFSNIVGYSKLSAERRPQEILEVLHFIFSRVDTVTEHLRVMKYEAVDNSYLTISNLERAEPHKGSVSALRMAVTLVRAVSGLAFEFEDGSVFKPEAQVGLHTGDVAGGTLGLKRKLMCMVGDAMNMSARMESTSLPSHIQASASFHEALPDPMRGLFEQRTVDVKGKGVMTAFLLDVAAKHNELVFLDLDLTAMPAWTSVLAREGQ